MVDKQSSTVITPMREIRGSPPAHSRGSGETTSFDLRVIQAARMREEKHEPMLLVCRGLQKGRPIPVRTGTWTLGRGPTCDICVNGRGISRLHLRLDYSTEAGVVISDAGSTNGVFINGTRVKRQTLGDRDVIHLGPETVLRFTYSPSCEMAIRVRQYENSIIDDLTGVHNRRFLMGSLDHEIAFAARHGQTLCLMLLDIDHFKSVNDRRGHQAGDAVIKQLATRIADAMRSEDVFARVGGEEFAILARDLDVATAREAAERVRTLVGAHPFHWQDTEIECTISIGGTILGANEKLDVSTLLGRADEKLYRAKEAGRNCVVIG